MSGPEWKWWCPTNRCWTTRPEKKHIDRDGHPLMAKDFVTGEVWLRKENEKHGISWELTADPETALVQGELF